ncbi:glycosyl hydrolase, partial [Bacteroidota bacterium]
MATGGLISGVPFLNSCSTDKVIEAPVDGGNLYELFQNPPPEAHPFFRWWWNGNNVTREEIIRELDLMKDAGIGGIEINPVEMPEQITGPEREGLVWLSDEWIDVLRSTVEETEKRDMVADLIVGTGWPFGAEFLEPEETIQGLYAKTKEFQGPGIEIAELPNINVENERFEQVVLIPEKIKDASNVRDYTAEIQDNKFVELELDQGKNILIVTVGRSKFRNVMHGAPGGAGPVLDHFNKTAVKKYLDNMSSKLNPALDGKMGNWIRAMFCDSIELAGANWTGDFEEEFERRRDYSITPYISLLNATHLRYDNNFTNILNRVRYDYSLTLSELFTERFIIPFHNWCNENGTLSRYQAYGFPWLYTDLVDGNLIADIPEGDQWLFNSGWSNAVVDNIRYAIWNKYASSGGHLKGRDIISSEAMTNTSGVFEGTLEYQKQATDLNIITGINHLVLHGFNYSPPGVDFPGWIRYGGYYNENNTWWPYMRYLSEYMARLSAVFQNSKPVLHVAIMAPIADVWSDRGLDRNTYNNSPWYLHSIWQALNHNGLCTDYISRKIINGGNIKKGKITYGPMSYNTLILCEVGIIDEETLVNLYQFVDSGGKLIFLGTQPDKSPGLHDWEENDEKVKSLVQKIIRKGGIIEKSPGEMEKNAQPAFSRWAEALIKKHNIVPEIEISDPDYKLFATKHNTNQEDIIFMANMDKRRSLIFDIRTKSDYKYLWSWNAESGDRASYTHDNNGVIDVVLKPLESQLLIFSNEKPVERVIPDESKSMTEFTLKGLWNVELVWGPVDKRESRKLIYIWKFYNKNGRLIR